jgi:hypothetical protein
MSTLYFLFSGGPNAVSIKSVKSRYAELVFLHLVGSAGHVLHFGASVVRNIDAFIIGRPSAVSIKSTLGHVMLNL